MCLVNVFLILLSAQLDKLRDVQLIFILPVPIIYYCYRLQLFICSHIVFPFSSLLFTRLPLDNKNITCSLMDGSNTTSFISADTKILDLAVDMRGEYA